MNRWTRIAVLSSALLVAVPSISSAAQDSTPPATNATPATDVPPATDPAATGDTGPDMRPTDPGAGARQPVTVVDETGSPIGTITITNVEQAWAGFGEYDKPASGSEYLRVTVMVESKLPRGLLAVEVSDFKLQDADGFLFGADSVRTADEVANDTEAVRAVELSSGQTAEITLTFEAVSGIQPTAIFYQPGYDRLITITQF